MASEDAVATLTEALARLGRGRSVKQDDSDAVALDAVEQGTKAPGGFRSDRCSDCFQPSPRNSISYPVQCTSYLIYS
jgi:hypothetical protein